MRYALLIPCYEPGASLLALVDALTQHPEADIYLVNDGSGPAYDPVFHAAENAGCRVISYHENQGKGYALRAGIRHIMASENKYFYIVTADADGQHCPEDIEKIAMAAERAALHAPPDNEDAPLILGVRNFGGRNVPLRSRFGNRFSSLYFKFVTGMTLSDTQTGLRAIPEHLYALAVSTPGDRYDYEMNFLIAAAKFIRTVPIQTVYENKNSVSHFQTVRDSLLIYKTPLRYISVSLISASVDLLLFFLLSRFLGALTGGVLAATAGARIASGIVNFSLNRRWSFSAIRSEEGRAGMQAARYLLLFIALLLVSGGLVSFLQFLPLPLTLTKACVDTGLAFSSYWAQHNWVFQNSGKSNLICQSSERSAS